MSNELKLKLKLMVARDTAANQRRRMVVHPACGTQWYLRFVIHYLGKTSRFSQCIWNAESSRSYIYLHSGIAISSVAERHQQDLRGSVALALGTSMTARVQWTFGHASVPINPSTPPTHRPSSVSLLHAYLQGIHHCHWTAALRRGLTVMKLSGQDTFCEDTAETGQWHAGARQGMSSVGSPRNSSIQVQTTSESLQPSFYLLEPWRIDPRSTTNMGRSGFATCRYLSRRSSRPASLCGRQPEAGDDQLLAMHS